MTLDYFEIGGRRYVPAVDRPPLWRVLHEAELPAARRVNPPNMPEVRPLFPNHHSEFGRDWQLLSRAMNPKISDSKWTVVYSWRLWMTNNHGFGNAKDPRANYVLGTDLDCENPRVEALTTGGSLLTGKVVGDSLVVETLDVYSPPKLEWILARPWYWTYAVSVDSRGVPRRFPQGLQPNGEIVPIIHPLVANPRRFTQITIPLWRVHLWTARELPDPYKLYLV